MPRTLTALVLAAALAPAAPVPKAEPIPAGVLVLDNCDREFRGKAAYADNLALLDADGKETFQLSGFNMCEAISSTHLIAADPARKCVWVGENAALQVRRFDLKTGKETAVIKDVMPSAVAVDAETGNVWVLTGPGKAGEGSTHVYDPDGKKLVTYDIPGWDLVYDKKAKAFWIADRKLTKVSAAKGEVKVSIDVCDYCVSSLAVDPPTGGVWVATVNHKGGGVTRDLIKYDTDGKELHRTALNDNPMRISADPKDGSVWVVKRGTAVEHFSAKGESEAVHPVEAIAVQVDPAGGDIWVVTRTEVQRITPKGEVTKRAKLAGKTTQAWITAVE